jgi:hypothetical protein
MLRDRWRRLRRDVRRWRPVRPGRPLHGVQGAALRRHEGGSAGRGRRAVRHQGGRHGSRRL